MELLALVLGVSVVAHAMLVGRAAGKAATKFERAMREVASGIFERGERPETDYPVFDEELARIHLEQMDENPLRFNGQLTLEYEPSDADAY